MSIARINAALKETDLEWLAIGGMPIDTLLANVVERLIAENKKLRATLRIFEDGANWERYPGLSDKPEYVWRHDSDPRVLAQDARNKPDGGTK